jgi:F-type H+-transporting ATPase subunit b
MLVTPVYAQESAPAGTEAPSDGETHGAAGGDAHTEVAHDGGSAGFPPFETTYFASQLLWLAITFGLFYLFLQRVVLPRIGGILEVRRDRIAQDLEQAARMKGEADGAVAAYEQELAEARVKANAIGQEARDKARADAEAERKRVEAALDGKLAEAEARIAGIKSRAMGEVDKIAEDTAAEIVRALAGKPASKDAIVSAVRAAQS